MGGLSRAPAGRSARSLTALPTPIMEEGTKRSSAKLRSLAERFCFLTLVGFLSPGLVRERESRKAKSIALFLIRRTDAPTKGSPLILRAGKLGPTQPSIRSELRP